ncbi:hypothetical protein QYM36_016856 [Artemia franciscana]|uniref:Uncharacterized protein n=1 Tax=Artemia franciscana TaxID=6661 RepID=A0AA88KWB5_ARTSF|nr:hypothetical protein QYM36_016856 [Artemia franciscana]
MPAKQRKVALLGFRSVGKSSLAIQFVEGHFVDNYDPTIENTFVKVFKLKGQDYELRIVDTAGQDEFSLFPSHYTMDIHGYIFVYAITSRSSFEIVRTLYEKLLDMSGKQQVPAILVGNKCDLLRDRAVSIEEGKQLADYMHAAFFETSARSREVSTLKKFVCIFCLYLQPQFL